MGGNIRGQTRSLTTAVALYTGQGDFGLALALGCILLLLALLVNVALQAPRVTAVLELRGVCQRYEGRTVLELDHFTVARGAIVAIVGPDGSGKSPLLRLAALLEAPSAGEVWIAGRRAPRTAAARRQVSLVEQRPVLFRGSVRENLEFGCEPEESRAPSWPPGWMRSRGNSRSPAC